MNIEWTPNSNINSESCHFRLMRKKSHVLKLKPNIIYAFIGILFLVVGSWLLYFLTYGEPVTQSTFGITLGYLLGVAFCLVGVGPFLFIFEFEEVSFDALNQKIIINRRFTYPRDKVCLNFSQVESIQLLKKFIKDADGDYLCYELNLVLVDGVRKTLIDHGNKRVIKEDARVLSKLLKKELHSNAD